MSYAYDAQARLATVTDKMGNAAGQNSLRHQLHDAYDGATRHQTTITAPDGRVRVANTYDSQGRVYQQRDGLNAARNLPGIEWAFGYLITAVPRGRQKSAS
jgi:hypothetical protein